jgi:trehalose 6-phosphate synthase/phosphatase
MNAFQRSKNRLVIVSNRLPIVLEKDTAGRWQAKPGSGGLVTAMAPVLRDRGGLWIGWPGTAEKEDMDLKALLREAVKGSGYTFEPVSLTVKEVDSYYYGFANEILWPLFHDLQTRCNFDPAYWRVYRRVNHKFAEVISRSIGRDDYIWVNDYHLIGVGRELRELGVTSQIGYFLHIPFPSLDLFLKLPWRFQILKALLAYDMVGFQTQRDKNNFVQCIRAMLKEVSVRGKGQVVTAEVDDREVRIGNFPISIDFDEFAVTAESGEVDQRVAEIQANLGSDSNRRTLLLGVDRLDYTKGIPERLAAFGNALERFPRLREKISLVQIVVPSRVNIPKYRDLKLEIERMVSDINGKYAQTGWVPIHYIFRSVDRTELIALYRAADIALITPLKDGMNLVAKEYCAANVTENGVLIMSEFAGAAAQLQEEALLVNPYDVEEVAETIATAADMPIAERRRRMKALRRKVRKFDIYWWVDSFLNAIFARDLKAFPPLEDYVPSGNEMRMQAQNGNQVWKNGMPNPVARYELEGTADAVPAGAAVGPAEPDSKQETPTKGLQATEKCTGTDALRPKFGYSKHPEVA